MPTRNRALTSDAQQAAAAMFAPAVKPGVSRQFVPQKRIAAIAAGLRSSTCSEMSGFDSFCYTLVPPAPARDVRSWESTVSQAGPRPPERLPTDSEAIDSTFAPYREFRRPRHPQLITFTVGARAQHRVGVFAHGSAGR